MPQRTDADELRARIAGHQAANERHRGAVMAMTMDEKLRQISRLMSSARMFDMSGRAADDRAVIEIWQRLRERWPGRG